MNADFKLRETEKVYYPQPLRIAPSPASTPLDPSSTSLVAKPNVTLTSIISPEKEKEQQPQSPIVELRPEKVIEVEQEEKK